MRVFIGGDIRQPVAFNVLAHSILRRSSGPVSITKLDIRQLPITRRGLTEFTYTRYLVPYLCGYDGVALFLDADMMCLCDIYELHLREEQFEGAAVALVTEIPAFERPSMMVFNNRLCRQLTPDFIQNEKPNGLRWSEKILSLPKAYNHVVPYSGENAKAKIVHFTQGIPVFNETRNCEYADAWREEHTDMNSTVPWKDIMGGSVHEAFMEAKK